MYSVLYLMRHKKLLGTVYLDIFVFTVTIYIVSGLRKRDVPRKTCTTILL